MKQVIVSFTLRKVNTPEMRMVEIMPGISAPVCGDRIVVGADSAHGRALLEAFDSGRVWFNLGNVKYAFLYKQDFRQEVVEPEQSVAPQRAYTNHAFEQQPSLRVKGPMMVKRCLRRRTAYKGFTLKRNFYYGIDAHGSFATSLVRRAGDSRATLKVYRLDPERGWLPQWERNPTTLNIIANAVQNRVHQDLREYDLRDAVPNRMACVPNDHGVRHMGNYDKKGQFSRTVGYGFDDEQSCVPAEIPTTTTGKGGMRREA